MLFNFSHEVVEHAALKSLDEKVSFRPKNKGGDSEGMAGEIDLAGMVEFPDS